MKAFRAIPPIFLAMAMAAGADQPRFALVRVKDIYANLPSTQILQQDLNLEREAIQKDQRAEELRKILAELQALQAQLQDKSNTMDAGAREKLVRTFEIKRQETQTLQQEFENFRTEQEKAINKKMVAGMRKSLDRIVGASNKLAKERGYNTIFDSSGSTNTGVPFILYSKNAPDLTADVEAVLKDSEPPAPAKKPAPAQPAVPASAPARTGQAPSPVPPAADSGGAGHID